MNNQGDIEETGVPVEDIIDEGNYSYYIQRFLILKSNRLRIPTFVKMIFDCFARMIMPTGYYIGYKLAMVFLLIVIETVSLISDNNNRSLDETDYYVVLNALVIIWTYDLVVATVLSVAKSGIGSTISMWISVANSLVLSVLSIAVREHGAALETWRTCQRLVSAAINGVFMTRVISELT